MEEVKEKGDEEEEEEEEEENGQQQQPDVDVYWGEYERIDWNRVGLGEVVANCYCIRKGLIRKAQLAYTMRKWSAKHPTSEIARCVPETHVFELYDIEYFDEVLIADVPELRNIQPGKDVWILKPNITNQALGVRVFNDLETLRGILSSEEAWNLREWIAQRYVSRPLLVGGKKFHVRVYALAVGAMEVYVYDDMLALFAAEKYDSSLGNLENARSHLTNTCRVGMKEAAGIEESSIVKLLDELPGAERAAIEEAKAKIKLLVGQCFEAVSSELSFMPMPNCFELFGFDFLIDEDWHCWLLEANAEPDFVQTGQRLQSVIGEMIQEVYHKAVVPLVGELGSGLHKNQNQNQNQNQNGNGNGNKGRKVKNNKWCKVFEKHVSGSEGMNFQIV